MKKWYDELEHRFGSFRADVQILHVVSDLTKARNLTKAGKDTAENHLYRALILLDYIAADPKWTSKLRELLRLRETIASLIVASRPFATIDQAISATLLLEPKAYNISKPSVVPRKNSTQ